MAYIGIDTSNYTTSVAVFFENENKIVHKRRLLKVKPGEKGLRQSDAVFQHTQNLPELIEGLFWENDIDIEAVGVSDRPCGREGSYMPCFTVGIGCARSICAANGKLLRCFTHQQGHIAAALWSADRLDLLKENFIAFHVSGGTTEAVLVTPDEENIFGCEIIASSLDLKAGQAVDRVGLMLGLDFPCGRQLDALARHSTAKIKKIRPFMRGSNCSLSGIENKCAEMKKKGKSDEDIARYCIEYISSALEKTVEAVRKQYGQLPLVFSGGVMSNSIIRERFTEKFGAVFAEPEFSPDNAAGIAVLASLK
ncbi:MAG: peptidase M22 [Clostridia bacterium]|nr:peptidase M22 [Clostridia bacterium]